MNHPYDPLAHIIEPLPSEHTISDRAFRYVMAGLIAGVLAFIAFAAATAYLWGEQ